MKLVQPEYYSKVWGSEIWLTNGKLYCGKILNLMKGYKCSYHSHKIKDETFYILKGRVLMKVEGVERRLKKGDTVHIPPDTKHSFTGTTNAQIIEISTQHFEDDSYREDESGKVL